MNDIVLVIEPLKSHVDPMEQRIKKRIIYLLESTKHSAQHFFYIHYWDAFDVIDMDIWNAANNPKLVKSTHDLNYNGERVIMCGYHANACMWDLPLGIRYLKNIVPENLITVVKDCTCGFTQDHGSQPTQNTQQEGYVYYDLNCVPRHLIASEDMPRINWMLTHPHKF